MRAVLVVALVACTPARSHPEAMATPTRVEVDPKGLWRDAVPKLLEGGSCQNAVLVWGSVKVDASMKARPVQVAAGAAKLDGFLLCSDDMTSFLVAQRNNPRFKPSGGGTVPVKWHDGQLFMRRPFSAEDTPVSAAAPNSEGVAAIFSSDETTPVGDFLGPVAKLPEVFVFAMLPIP